MLPTRADSLPQMTRSPDANKGEKCLSNKAGRIAQARLCHGVGVENDVLQWFELPKGQCPKTTVLRQKIARSLVQP
jgi:hypothetical protein